MRNGKKLCLCETKLDKLKWRIGYLWQTRNPESKFMIEITAMALVIIVVFAIVIGIAK
jgi:hypothetical protein